MTEFHESTSRVQTVEMPNSTLLTPLCSTHDPEEAAASSAEPFMSDEWKETDWCPRRWHRHFVLKKKFWPVIDLCFFFAIFFSKKSKFEPELKKKYIFRVSNAISFLSCAKLCSVFSLLHRGNLYEKIKIWARSLKKKHKKKCKKCEFRTSEHCSGLC